MRTRRLAGLEANDSQFRAARSLEQMTRAVRQDGLSAWQIFTVLVDGYGERPALGERAYELVADEATGRTVRRLLPEFTTITYAQLANRVEVIAGEWHHDPDRPVGEWDLVAVLGRPSADHSAVDLACLRLGAACVALPVGLVPAQLRPILEETAPRVLAASIEQVGAAVEALAGTTSVRRLVVFNFRPEVDDEADAVEAARERLAELGLDVEVSSLTDVTERGALLPAAPWVDPLPDRLALLVYTSGSTGSPKGAMYTDRLLAALWRMRVPGRDEQPMIEVTYLPMGHIGGVYALLSTLATGGTAYFVGKSDLSTLFEDISLVRPTTLMLVPRVWEMVYQRYNALLASRAGDSEAEVLAEIRESVLGGRMLWGVFLGAPLSAELAAFAERVLEFPLRDGYGLTEAGHVLMDGEPVMDSIREFALADVPELGYFSTDVPHPRGELIIKSRTLIAGYFKRPELNARLFDEQGYYHTGDVFAEVGPNRFSFIDRRNNVMKLSQGEFVAVTELEALFETSSVVRQIYLYGSSERSYLLAVVVPTPAVLERAGEIRSVVGDALRSLGAEAGLSPYEIPRDVLIESEPFTLDNGLLSGTRKLLRPKLEEHYGVRLEQLYDELTEREARELNRLRSGPEDQRVVDTVVGAASAVLSTTSGDVSANSRFPELGGDSLSALTFSVLLGEIFAVEVPVGIVLSPIRTLQAIADYIELKLRPGTQQASFAGVHGAGSDRVRAADLQLGRFIDAATLDKARGLPRPGSEVKTVLLTGATGFLGRFLCLDWLERLAETGGTLVCLVRAESAEAARARLDAAFDGDDELRARFRQLAESHLEVLVGDVSEPDLGLDSQTWSRLAETVDLISHLAAQVNHVLPYDQLFGPNVVGTAEVIKLAVSVKLKPVSYLSTVAVLTSQISATDEDSDIRCTSPFRVLDDSYASGYATSKWAGEVLLREAHDAYGLPAAVFRSDLILAPSRYAGQLNVRDVFTRAIFSMIVTGIAPASFYRSPGPAHFDGLPVDFTARAVTELGARTTAGYQTYNVLNPHEDGISLDTYVDWLIEAGHPITRLDHEEWFHRCETALRALPERQKRRSLLPLLEAFRTPAEARPGAEFPTTRFRAATEPLMKIPHVTRDLISRYPETLHQMGLL